MHAHQTLLNINQGQRGERKKMPDWVGQGWERIMLVIYFGSYMDNDQAWDII